MRKKKLKTDLVLAVDLDGVIAEYEGWKGYNVIGAPKKGAIKYLKKLHEEGWTIIIFTSRPPTHQVTRYLHRWGIPYDGLNRNINDWFRNDLNCKIYANVYLDDRSWRDLGRKWNWRRVYRVVRRKHKHYYE